MLKVASEQIGMAAFELSVENSIGLLLADESPLDFQ
jgi:hypothetical protein